MTTNCEQFLERALGLGDADAVLPDELRAHLATCAACRAVQADLIVLREAAAGLAPPAVPVTTWPRLARRLEHAGVSRPAPRHAPVSVTWLAVAASLLVTLGAALWMVARGPANVPDGGTRQAATSPDGSNGTPPELVESIESELTLAAEHYEKAIAGLEQAASASDSPLDREVMAMLRQNLGVIDQAIDESRGALRRQPSNRVAQESLFEAFRRKVSLLQDTISLMNEMRKGDEAGTARAVESLKKS